MFLLSEKENKWIHYCKLDLGAQLVECLIWGTGGHGFDPGPGHTKVIKMVLAAPRLALRHTG